MQLIFSGGESKALQRIMSTSFQTLPPLTIQTGHVLFIKPLASSQTNYVTAIASTHLLQSPLELDLSFH